MSVRCKCTAARYYSLLRRGLLVPKGRLLRTGTNRALGLSNELFVLGDSVVLTVLGQVAFMPVLVLAARLCPEVRASL